LQGTEGSLEIAGWQGRKKGLNHDLVLRVSLRVEESGVLDTLGGLCGTEEKGSLGMARWCPEYRELQMTRQVTLTVQASMIAVGTKE
jgi:hypothetical protein